MNGDVSARPPIATSVGWEATEPPPGYAADSVVWSRVNFTRSPAGCWIWCGSRNLAGYAMYGSFSVARKVMGLRRTHFDPVEVSHECDNPPCVNPAHLVVGAHAENMLGAGRRNRHGQQLSKRAYRKLEDVDAWERFCAGWGIDAYSAWQWLTGQRPCPPRVADFFLGEFGADAMTLVVRAV